MALPFAQLQGLVPALQLSDIVVMDRLGAHKLAGIAAALPLSSRPPVRSYVIYRLTALTTPRLNKSLPSQNLTQKTAARTVQALWSAFGSLLDQFPANEYEQYPLPSGYGRPG